MFLGFADRLRHRCRADSASVQHRQTEAQVESKLAPKWQCVDMLEHHTAREHAHLLLDWIRRNVEREHGVFFHEAMQEFHIQAIIDAGWAARPWNPIARELDLICTGGAKPYAWTMTDAGRMQRRRYYPIPAECRRTKAA